MVGPVWVLLERVYQQSVRPGILLQPAMCAELRVPSPFQNTRPGRCQPQSHLDWGQRPVPSAFCLSSLRDDTSVLFCLLPPSSVSPPS
jgi:hypothetical protein